MRRAPDGSLPGALLALLASLCLAAPLAAAGGARGNDAHRWTVDDIVTAQTAGDWTVSRDGRLAAWVESRVAKVGEKGEKRISNLWLARADGGAKGLPLTRGQDRVSSPAFSPDGGRLAFLSDRELPAGGGKEGAAKPAERQLWVIPVAGGEAFPATRLDRDARALGWIADDTLVVAAEESPSAWEAEKKKEKDTSVVVDDAAHKPPVRLFRVTLAPGGGPGRVERLTTNDDWIDALAVSPDGRRAVATAQRSLSYEFDQKTPPWTYLVDLATGAMTRILEPTPGERPLLPFAVRWAPDSSGFYFADAYSTHPLYRTATVTRLWWYDPATGTPTEVDLGWDRGLSGAGYEPIEGGFLALLADGVRHRPARYVRSGGTWQRQDLEGDDVRNLDEWAAAPDGSTLVYETSSATRPPQGYLAHLEGHRIAAPRQVTDLNPGWKDKPTGRVEVVHWKGARGDTVEGLLHYPLDWKEGERRPLVLDIHGGPAGADRDTWDERWPAPDILYRQKGAFILQVNYHGSSSYGLEWVESIEKHYYELEVPDIEAGVDQTIARGLVDPERVATSGWSNGGILSAALITHSRRYKAASIGAADVEWVSDWANVDFGASFDNYYFGGPPWEIPQVYIEKSPFFHLPEVTTPTIAYTGTEDRNVPPHESWELFRAMQQIGKAPVRLVVFPGEPHGLRQIPHQRRKVEEDLAWFDRYLFGRPEAEHPWIPEGSRLSGLLERAGAARVGSAFGHTEGGVLAPETVRFPGREPGGLQVGRFEVTRAQWHAFDASSEVAPAEENLPATGMGFERASAYVRWLSETTGRRFRLPTRAEAEELAKKAGRGGNTLDRWAGYTPNPEDRGRILEALAAGGGSLSLLEPVGSHAGTGEPAVFDLDGNAAEWAVDGERGAPVGASADRTTDPRSTAAPGAGYVGLRVVVEAPAP